MTEFGQACKPVSNVNLYQIFGWLHSMCGKCNEISYIMCVVPFMCIILTEFHMIFPICMVNLTTLIYWKDLTCRYGTSISLRGHCEVNRNRAY